MSKYKTPEIGEIITTQIRDLHQSPLVWNSTVWSSVRKETHTVMHAASLTIEISRCYRHSVQKRQWHYSLEIKVNKQGCVWPVREQSSWVWQHIQDLWWFTRVTIVVRRELDDRYLLCNRVISQHGTMTVIHQIPGGTMLPQPIDIFEGIQMMTPHLCLINLRTSILLVFWFTVIKTST